MLVKKPSSLDRHGSGGLLGGSGKKGDASDGGSGSSSKPTIERGSGLSHESVLDVVVVGLRVRLDNLGLLTGEVGVVLGQPGGVGLAVRAFATSGPLDDRPLAVGGLRLEVERDDRGKSVNNFDGAESDGTVLGVVLGGIGDHEVASASATMDGSRLVAVLSRAEEQVMMVKVIVVGDADELRLLGAVRQEVPPGLGVYLAEEFTVDLLFGRKSEAILRAESLALAELEFPVSVGKVVGLLCAHVALDIELGELAVGEGTGDGVAARLG